MARMRDAMGRMPDVVRVGGLVAALGVVAVVLIVAASVAIPRFAVPSRPLALNFDLTAIPVATEPRRAPSATPTVALVVAWTNPPATPVPTRPPPTATAAPTAPTAPATTATTVQPTATQPAPAPTRPPATPPPATPTARPATLATATARPSAPPPTATPWRAAPTPTSNTALASGKGIIAVPTGQRAMLRAGPSRSDAIVGRVPSGSEVGIVKAAAGEEIEPDDGRWLQIRWESTVGYVYARLVSPR